MTVVVCSLSVLVFVFPVWFPLVALLLLAPVALVGLHLAYAKITPRVVFCCQDPLVSVC